MWDKIKKPLGVLLIIFAFYVILTSPNRAAAITVDIATVLWAALQNLFVFFDAVLTFLQRLFS